MFNLLNIFPVPATQVLENSAGKAGKQVKVHPGDVFDGELKI